jgi:hypothetical protein
MKASNKISGNRRPFAHFLMIFWPPILVFSFHVFLVRVLNVYNFFPWLDIPMHYLGGLSMAYSLSLAYTSLQNHKIISQLDTLIELVLVFSLVSTVAIFWEFAEFLLDQLLGTSLQISLPNTMQDLLMGVLGAGTIVGYKIIKSPERVFLRKY